VGPRAGLEVLGKKKIFWALLGLKPQIVQSVTYSSHYSDWAVLTHAVVREHVARDGSLAYEVQNTERCYKVVSTPAFRAGDPGLKSVSIHSFVSG
jgi:hypothetical protein